MNSLHSFATLLLVPSLAGSLALSAQAQVTAAGDGTRSRVTRSGNQLTIDGGTRSGANLFHSFEKFGLSRQQIATFLSHPGIRNILGRVTGGEASVINGLIQVTGGNSNLFLMNPAGIIFGANARLDVPGSFTATTANAIGIGDGWFNAVGANDYAALVGNPNQFAFTNAGAIVNAGNLAVGPGQSLTLLGGTVINTGTLSAPAGTVTIAAIPHQKLVRITQQGSLLSLDLPIATQAAINPQPFNPASLPALLTGGTVAEVTGVAVENGIVKLTRSGAVIPSETGVAIASGELTGQTIYVLGPKVGVVSATLNAAGMAGGGTVLIGGDYQGKGTVPNAQQTYVSRDSVINVDAGRAGKGGQAIVWADGATRFYGTISARGGSVSGNGGFVEVSGKQNLTFDGTVDVTATNGISGQLLLDPATVNIVAGAGADDAQLDDQQILATDAPGSTFTVSSFRLAQALATGDVTIAATNAINFTSSVSLPANTPPSSQTLSLTAPTIAATNGSSLFLLNGTSRVNVRLQSPTGQNLQLSGLSVSTDGNITVQTPGVLTVNQSFLAAAGDLQISAQAIPIVIDSQFRSSRNLTVQAQTNATLQGSSFLADGNLRLQAGNQLNIAAPNPTQAFVARSGGDLTVQGNQAITIQALTQPQSGFISNGNLSLVSNGTITANSRFGAGGTFAARTVAGNPGSLNYSATNASGIISANGDITFGDYTGNSLKVEARGSIRGGAITITGANTALTGSDPDIATLSATPSLILRAGLSQLQNPVSQPRPLSALQNQPNVPAPFTATATASTPGNITVQSITIAAANSAQLPLDAVTLAAPGSITIGTAANPGNISLSGGSVNIRAGGDLRLGDVSVDSGTSNLFLRSHVRLASQNGNLRAGDLSFSAQRTYLNLAAQKDMQVSTIANRGVGGRVDIRAGGLFRATGTFTRTPQSQDVPYAFPDRAQLTTFISQSTGLQGTALTNYVNSLIAPDSPAFISILINPTPSVFVSSGATVPPGTQLLRIQHGGKLFLAGAVDTKNPANVNPQTAQYAPLNVSAFPSNASGTAGAITFSAVNSTLIQSFPSQALRPGDSYLRIVTNPPPPIPPDGGQNNGGGGQNNGGDGNNRGNSGSGGFTGTDQIQRQFVDASQSNDCAPNRPIAPSRRDAAIAAPDRVSLPERSPQVTNPCQPTENADPILKILDDDASSDQDRVLLRPFAPPESIAVEAQFAPHP